MRKERGQATLLLFGVVAALLVGALVLGAFGQALGAKSRHQRAADLAAMSAGASMAKVYPRLFEPAVLPNGVPNPRRLSTARYQALARAAAIKGGRRNGVTVHATDVRFPGGSFAPTRVTVAVHGKTSVRVHGGAHGRRSVPVEAQAAAEIAPPVGAGLDQPSHGSGGGYDGPLAYRMGKPMRPDTAEAFDRMAAAARRAGIYLSVTSGFRSDAEQARLFAAHPDPKWVAPPGTSLHRYGTELDLGPPGAYAWLATNARRFGFIKRYAWEPWHFGFGANPRDRAHPAQYERGSWEPPGGDHDRIHHRLPSFVPPRFHDPIAKAALRWNVPMNVLAAQLYAESGFNPFATSNAGAQGIAQFMPGTARSYGLSNAYDPFAAIDAQAHLMSDLLRQFGKVALALAAYNAGSGAVEKYGGVPPFAETRAYVARILGLLGGAGEIPVSVFEVRLVE
jgi:transglycosylase-like protein with SLT domain/D-alanyl-D-alanine carboxypeptidase-like protein/putative Flp pilus-assembly TadE/G-like protein